MVWMVAARQILDTFVKDAWRMSERALGVVHECETRLSGFVPVESTQVRQLFQLTHTMKGTACMIRDARPIVESLQELEGMLTVQSLESSAQSAASWLPTARSALERTRRELERLRLALSRDEIIFSDERDRKTETVKDSSMGIMAVVTEGVFAWLPLDRLIKVYSPLEIAERRMILLSGRWVPVYRLSPHKGAFGILFRDDRGSMVVTVDTVIGVESWRRAKLRAARALATLVPSGATIPLNAEGEVVKKVA